MPRCLLPPIVSFLLTASAQADMPAEEWKPALAATFSGDAIEECLSMSPDQSVCIGQQTSACIATSTEVPSDFIQSICTEIELEWWDARLNARYGEVMTLNEDFDREFGNTDVDPSQTLVGTYREAQRAWIGFRDASCSHESLSTGAKQGPAADEMMLTCVLRMTATRTLEMERSLSNKQ